MDITAKPKRKVYELQLTDSLFDESGVNLMSFVTEPAMEVEYVFFSKEGKDEIQRFEFAMADSEKRIVVGPALIPNKYIPRKDKNTGEEFYVYFTEETIRKTAEKFLRTSAHLNSNVQHAFKAEDAYAVESWVVEDPEKDKANYYGFSVPKGTWMVSYKVLNDEVWELIKTKQLNGFSIEGSFMKKYEASMSKNEIDEVDVIKNIILQGKSDEEIYDELVSYLQNGTK